MRARLSCAISVLALLAAGPAVAHKRPPLRAVTFQVEKGGVVALWRAELAGQPATLLRANYDRDHDGQLDERERLRLAAAVMAKVMRGVEVRLDGAALKLADLEARIEAPQGGSKLVTLALATLETESPPAPGRRTLTVEMKHGGALMVGAQGLEGWRLVTTSRGAIVPPGALGEPISLALDERLVLSFEHRAQQE